MRMLTRDELINTFLKAGYSAVYLQAVTYGEILKDRKNTIAGNAMRWMNLTIHSLQIQVEIVNGQLKTVKLSKQNNLF